METRRRFLRTLTAGGSVVLLPGVFAACEDKDDNGMGPGDGDPVVLNLSTDIGIFNYAYALEQLEAAFYTQVVGRFSAAGITNAMEQSILTDIRDHEVIHREFFRAALGSAGIPDLAVDFGAALNSRQSILETARTFEDLGVSAYNGAGKYLADARNLLAAGKIVSVEARHASVIRDILDSTGRDFAGDAVVDAQGLDVVREPEDVLPLADPFITTTISIGTQPSA
ncbi:MAG: ferritin-like domain-containing protein [Longimicrobiales bacterium]